MNLVALFDQLEIPEQSKENTLIAIAVPGFPNFRIAVGVEATPVLLFSTAKNGSSIKLKNVRLKYLSVNQNVECKVTENSVITLQSFTLISFASSDRHLQGYFLQIAETLVRSLGTNPTDEQILDTLLKFVEVFRSLSDAPRKTVQGLWAELFLIKQSRVPRMLVEYWHVNPEEKFDFNASDERIEVKSNTKMERVHFFSAEQLSPPDNVQVLVASLLLKQTNAGISFQSLVDEIAANLSDNLELVRKLHSTVCKTLGASLEDSIAVKYDPILAMESLRFFRYQDIMKIESDDIPPGVSEVRYRSDLSHVSPVDILQLETRGRLFGGL